MTTDENEYTDSIYIRKGYAFAILFTSFGAIVGHEAGSAGFNQLNAFFAGIGVVLCLIALTEVIYAIVTTVERFR